MILLVFHSLKILTILLKNTQYQIQIEFFLNRTKIPYQKLFESLSKYSANGRRSNIWLKMKLKLAKMI